MPPKGIINWIIWIPRRIARGLIVIYQKTLSLDHGPLARFVPYPTCKYHPTCSEYGYGAISRFGIIRGIPMTIWRIMRCNPWSEGGFDPVPEKRLNHDSSR
ncbi:membrane protein insertion efficiency factor YidD [Candidatus Uhrbacteria bacterium]|nr:membrane protein insertion efficiency factor YidD [Candidatus Uhrbacteria bacterium]